MSINYCTLNSSSVDGFCGAVRAKVLARLLLLKYGPPVTPVQPTGSGSSGIRHGTPVRPQYAQYREREQWVPPIISTELDRIIVDVHVLSQDFRGRAEQAVRPDNNIVVVTNVQVEGSTLSVNINNLRFNQTHDVAS